MRFAAKPLTAAILIALASPAAFAAVPNITPSQVPGQGATTYNTYPSAPITVTSGTPTAPITSRRWIPLVLLVMPQSLPASHKINGSMVATGTSSTPGEALWGGSFNHQCLHGAGLRRPRRHLPDRRQQPRSADGVLRYAEPDRGQRRLLLPGPRLIHQQEGLQQENQTFLTMP